MTYEYFLDRYVSSRISFCWMIGKCNFKFGHSWCTKYNETQEYAYLLVRYKEHALRSLNMMKCTMARIRYQEMKEGWYTTHSGLLIGMIITIFILFNLLSPLNNNQYISNKKLLPTSPFSSPQKCNNEYLVLTPTLWRTYLRHVS